MVVLVEDVIVFGDFEDAVDFVDFEWFDFLDAEIGPEFEVVAEMMEYGVLAWALFLLVVFAVD